MERAQSQESMWPEEIDAFASQLRVAEDHVRGYATRATGSDLDFMSTLKHSYQQQRRQFTGLYARKLSYGRVAFASQSQIPGVGSLQSPGATKHQRHLHVVQSSGEVEASDRR
jgi:hypothetical protein